MITNGVLVIVYIYLDKYKEEKGMAEPLTLRYLSAKAAKNRIPLSGTFELSPCCNLDCRMCYVRKSYKEVMDFGGEKTVEQWLKLARECKEAGMLFLLLTGGEPFLYKGFRRLYTELKKMGFMITINTNGTLINEEVVQWLKNDPPSRLQITLYGGSNETYERLCRDKNGFDKTTKAIRLLTEAGISVKINASMTQYNIDDIQKIYEFAEEVNVYVQASTYMFPPIRKNKDAIGIGDRFTPKEAASNLIKIEKLRLSKKEFEDKLVAMNKGIKKINTEFEECDDVFDNVSSESSSERDKMKCRAGRSSFWINWKGEMTPCGIMNWPVAYPFKDGLIKAWYDIIDETEKIRMPKKCTSCKNKNVCSVCAASVITETGDFNVAPKYICTMTENIIRETEKEYELMLVK